MLREALALRAALREGAERLAEGKPVTERTVVGDQPSARLASGVPQS